MRRFISLTKPGIIFGNAVTLTGGFFLGSRGHINVNLYLITLIGLSLVIAAGCVFNNLIDTDIDTVMERTKNRVLVKGLVSRPLAIAYALILCVLGFAILYIGTNLLVFFMAIVGFIVYVVLYSLFLKRSSVYGATIGGVSGAVAPVIGYCAVTGRFDGGALILFLILFFWQLPHFYAIAIYRLKDFAAAGIPAMPIKKGLLKTKLWMVVYTIAFGLSAIAPTFFGYAGVIYFIVALGLSLYWLWLNLQGFQAKDDRVWARKVFGFSILCITILCLVMAIH